MADREIYESAYTDDDATHYDSWENSIDEENMYDEFQPPEHGWRKALLIGIGCGLVSVLLPLIVVFAAHNLYQEGARLGAKMPDDLAQTLFLLSCIGLFLNLAVAFIAGFVTGRLAVRRGLGFLAGALVGAITEIGYIVENMIPGFPGRLSASAASTPPPPGGIAVSYLLLLIFVVVYALVGGLMGRFGAAAATNKHPYYEMRREQG